MATAKKSAATTTPPALPADTPTGDLLAAEAVPAAPPNGHELLRPMHTLPRRTRADLLELFGKVMAGMPELQAAEQDLSEIGGEDGQTVTDSDIQQLQRFAQAGAGMLRMAADVEDAMAIGAHDHAAFTAWAASVGEDELFALFNWYTQSLGEAPASPN